MLKLTSGADLENNPDLALVPIADVVMAAVVEPQQSWSYPLPWS